MATIIQLITKSEILSTFTQVKTTFIKVYAAIMV